MKAFVEIDWSLTIKKFTKDVWFRSFPILLILNVLVAAPLAITGKNPDLIKNALLISGGELVGLFIGRKLFMKALFDQPIKVRVLNENGKEEKESKAEINSPK